MIPHLVMATSNYTFVYFELAPSSGKSYILFLLFSSTHYGTLWAILTQRLQQQRGGRVRDSGGDGEWMSICILSSITSYKLPRIDLLLSYTNKYGTTHSMHTNTHICAPAAHSLSKIQFQRWPVRRIYWPLSGKEFEWRCQGKWERSRSCGNL